MDLLPALRLTAHLNSYGQGLESAEHAAHAALGDDVAHHVIDPNGVLPGLDPLNATALEQAFPLLISAASGGWILSLPVPGALGPLRGPAPFSTAALEAGQAVVAVDGGIGLVPHLVGRAVQWQVFAAVRPFTPPTVYEAERHLGEAVHSATAALTALDVAAGTRPTFARREPQSGALAPGYPPRQIGLADRALRLLAALDLALVDDGGALSSYEAETRGMELRRLRTAATEALCAAATWIAVDA